MKLLTLAVFLILTLALVGSAVAVPPGKTAEWETPMGKVVFDGAVHKDAGLTCTDCHPKLFQMKSGSFGGTVADHNAGQQYCWACHNGTKAFAAQGNCAKCHTK